MTTKAERIEKARALATDLIDELDNDSRYFVIAPDEADEYKAAISTILSYSKRCEEELEEHVWALAEAGSGVAGNTPIELGANIKAKLKRCEERAERLREALTPFADGASHTRVFLTSREKMHPSGIVCFDEDVARAHAALKGEAP